MTGRCQHWCFLAPRIDASTGRFSNFSVVTTFTLSTVASFSSPEARSLVFNTPYLYSLLQSCYTALAAEPAEPSGKGSPDTVFVLLNSIGTVATYPELGADLVTKAKSGTADTGGVAQASDVLAIVQASWGAKLGQAALQGLSEVQALFR